MVLVSRDGKPRVRTPSQQQMQEKRQLTARSNDLNAVSNWRKNGRPRVFPTAEIKTQEDQILQLKSG